MSVSQGLIFFARGYGHSRPDLGHWLIAAVLLVCGLGLAIVFARVVYFVLTAPLRRRERALLFLEVLDAATGEGRSAEQAFSSLERHGDRSLGRRFGLVVMRMREGSGFTDSLRLVPGFLPPNVVETLAVGERLGDVRAVLPACRQILNDTSSRMRGTINYFIMLMAGGAFFSSTGILGILLGYIVPQFARMFEEMGLPLPWYWHALQTAPIPLLSLCLSALLTAAIALYAGGPRLLAHCHLRRPAEWLFFLLPWRRKRMQRDFSAMLAVLLDAGVPEAEAVTMAAECTANRSFRWRARAVVGALEAGEPLTEAVRHLDRAGEFRWRLSNAVHAGGGFVRALAGWHAALDAKAYQQEQAAAHVISTAVVIAVGAMVGFIAIAVFEVLTGMIWGLTIW